MRAWLEMSLSWTALARLLLGSAGAGLAGWSGYVVSTRRGAPGAASSFRAGSADDLIMDMLETGDVLFFERDATRMLPLGAAAAAATARAQGRHGDMAAAWQQDDHDHVGVVVVHPRTGVAHVLEHTFGGGPVLRPFDERLLRSHARRVTLLPLLCCLEEVELRRGPEDGGGGGGEGEEERVETLRLE